MRIVFLGAVEFSAHCLRAVLDGGGRVELVLGLPPERARRHSDYVDLIPIAEAAGVPSLHVTDVNAPDVVAAIRETAPDVIFVFGWSGLLGPEVLALPPLGCIGTHPALLPANRGRHPVVWALADGLTRSGLTFFRLDEGVDSGDIVWQSEFEIGAEDDAADVYAKIEQLAEVGIKEFLPRLADGTAVWTVQDHTRATYRRKRTDEDREIKWAAPTSTIHNLVRALARPYLGAVGRLEEDRVIVWRAALPREPLAGAAAELPPGTVVARADGWIDVRTGDGHLRLLEVERLT